MVDEINPCEKNGLFGSRPLNYWPWELQGKVYKDPLLKMQIILDPRYIFLFALHLIWYLRIWTWRVYSWNAANEL